MATDRSKQQPAAPDNHISDHRLTDVYHRGAPEGSPGRAFVFCFEDRSHQLTLECGDPRPHIAERLRQFADLLEEGPDA